MYQPFDGRALEPHPTVPLTVPDETGKSIVMPVDIEVVPLVTALNRLPGVRTTSSCQGEKDPERFSLARVFFYVVGEAPRVAGLLAALSDVVRAAAPLSGYWFHVIIGRHYAYSPVEGEIQCALEVMPGDIALVAKAIEPGTSIVTLEAR